MNESIIAVIAEVLDADPSSLSADTDRETLSAWDSLAHLQIISEIEGRFCVKIPFEAVAQIRCAADFEKFIQ